VSGLPVSRVLIKHGTLRRAEFALERLFMLAIHLCTPDDASVAPR
jgi:hypothetical protein